MGNRDSRLTGFSWAARGQRPLNTNGKNPLINEDLPVVKPTASILHCKLCKKINQLLYGCIAERNLSEIISFVLCLPRKRKQFGTSFRGTKIETNSRNSILWNKNRSKLLECHSEPFRGRENNSEQNGQPKISKTFELRKIISSVWLFCNTNFSRGILAEIQNRLFCEQS
jgi:hypothetical protein